MKGILLVAHDLRNLHVMALLGRKAVRWRVAVKAQDAVFLNPQVDVLHSPTCDHLEEVFLVFSWEF